MERKELQAELNRFRLTIIKQSRSNLTRLKKNVSKKLYNSIKGVSKVSKNSIELSFSMEDYGYFQDKGVSGTGPAGKDKDGNPKQVVRNGKYKFGAKMPPTRVFDKWMVRRGIAPRGKDGKFQSRLSLKFAIARSVKQHGIKPSLFFTKPFDIAFARLPQLLIEKYGLDGLQLFNSLTKDLYKK